METDVGQVWGWGYGGEGQLGLGSCIRIVSFPQHIPCFNMTDTGNARSGVPIPGSYIKAIACGGRHSAVITGTHRKGITQLPSVPFSSCCIKCFF